MKNKRFIITLWLIVLSVAFIIIGAARDEHIDMMRKAVMICLECIGIG